MKTKDLKPIRPNPKYWEALESALDRLLRQEFYYPLLGELSAKKSTITNSIEDLVFAVSSGQIQYIRGHFEGRFNATLSKELRRLGAVWDRKQGWWKIPQSKLPVDMSVAIGASYNKFKKMSERVNKRLDDLLPEDIAKKLHIEKILDTTIYCVNKEFESSVKGIAIAPQLTKEQKERLTAEYSKNMQLYIKDWMESEIKELRMKVSKSTYQGFRYETMIDTIRKSYGVSQNKAKFLARQETNLLVTKLHQVRLQSAGINQYRWVCVVGSEEHPVRPTHKALGERSKKGELFSLLLFPLYIDALGIWIFLVRQYL